MNWRDLLLIDDTDAHFLAGNIHMKRGYVYCRSYAGKHNGHSVCDEVAIHRLIMGLPKGDVRQVDHINRNRLDNRRSNLRIVTAAQNMQNLGSQKRNRSGIRGAHWDKASKRWKSEVRIDNKLFALGYFDSPEDAGQIAKEYRLAHMPFAVEV